MTNMLVSSIIQNGLYDLTYKSQKSEQKRTNGYDDFGVHVNFIFWNVRRAYLKKYPTYSLLALKKQAERGSAMRAAIKKPPRASAACPSRSAASAASVRAERLFIDGP